MVSRHNRIRDILVETCQGHLQGLRWNVGNKTHSTDILLPNWSLDRTSITSPLNPITLLEAGVLATVPAQVIETNPMTLNALN